MDKVYRKYKEAASKLNPQLMEELGVDMSEGGDHLGMGVVRKENDLNNDEKQFLLTVERGDIPKTRNFLEESQIYFNININCVDPLGRTALLIAIENENIEMIELLLMYNVELGDALLHAINEENVEAVELLLSHQQSMSHKKDLSVSTANHSPTTHQQSMNHKMDLSVSTANHSPTSHKQDLNHKNDISVSTTNHPVNTTNKSPTSH